MYFYNYDCNGTRLTRVENGVSYTQGWNQENRLQTVTVDGATTTFTYDGDGVLVKKTVGITTTYYVNAGYEKTGSVVTKYYYAGSQRVAMRVCTGTNGSCGTNGVTSTLSYLHGDHLGSASLSTNATGGKVNEMRYYPYGETRSGAIATDRRYTGQRQEIGLGLYDYNARFYDPLLGRFLSADSIVPSPANPQSLNRYAYVLNNPLRYTDPTGHIPVPGAYADDRFRGRASSIDPVQFAGDWETEYRSAVNTTARIIAQRIVKIAQADQAKAAERATLTGEDPAVFASSLSPLWGLSEKDAFKAVYGTVTFRRIAGNTIDGWAETHLDWAGNGCSRGQICYDSSMFNANPSTFGIMKNAAHELGHGIDQRGGRQARADLAAAWNTMPLRRTEGGFANGGGWQQNRAPAAGEVFADMFLGWTFNSWGTNDAGTARSQYMRANMPGVVALAVAGN